MQLKCPNCSAPILAENINIQEMVAVCSECDHVFEFSRSAVARKAKRRKLKPPNRVRVYEDDERLELSYWLVFGPGPKFAMVISLIALVFYGAIMVGAEKCVKCHQVEQTAHGVPECGIGVGVGSVVIIMTFTIQVKRHFVCHFIRNYRIGSIAYFPTGCFQGTRF